MGKKAKREKTPGYTHRAHVYYSGRVQGVGFRFTAERFAMDLGLVGFVKNLPDGRVELVCEGSQQKIQRLLDELQQSFLGRHIAKADVRWEQPSSSFDDFRVEYVL